MTSLVIKVKTTAVLPNLQQLLILKRVQTYRCVSSMLEALTTNCLYFNLLLSPPIMMLFVSLKPGSTIISTIRRFFRPITTFFVVIESRGVGVLIAVKKTILVSNVSTSNPNLPEAITITLPSVSLTLCCTYISPNCNEITMSEITSYISNNVMNRSDNTILVGDFNLPDINWDTLSAQSAASKSFCDFVFDKNLTQLVNNPTHIKGNILDLVLTNSSQLIQNLSTNSQPNSMQTDHFIITFLIPKSAPPPPQVASQYVFDFRKANYQGLCDYLLDIDFSHLYSSTDVEFIWSSLKNIIYIGMDIFIPKVRL